MRIFNIIAFLILYVLIIPLNGNTKIESKINFTFEEKEFIKKHPIIKFSDVNWKPFFEIKDKKNSGIFKEYYKLIEERTGLKFEFIQIGDGINFQLVLDALKNKQIDMIDGSGKTSDRQKYAIFSEPLMKVSLSIVSNKTNRYKAIDELENKTIALAKGSTAYEYVKDFLPKNNKIILTNGIKEALFLVENKKADVSIDNIIVLDYLIKNGNYKDIFISGIIDYDFKIYSIIRDDYRILQDILNKAILSISKKELFEINNKLILSSLFSNKIIINLSDKEKEYIKNTTFKIGLSENSYPFSFREKDKNLGFSYDLIHLLIDKSDLKLEYVFDSWSNNIKKFKNNELDLLAGISYTKNREKFTNFSESYYEIPNVIFSKEGEIKNFKNLESLKGKRIGITKGIYYYEDLKKLNLFYLFEYESTREMMNALAHDKVDVIFSNLNSGQKYIREYAYSDIVVLDEIKSNFIKKEDFRIGVKKNDELLFSIINKSFNAITFEEKRKLIEKWFYKERKNNTISLSKDEKTYLKNKKQILVCIDPHWMPLEKIEDSQYIGLSAEYMELFSTLINTPINLLETKSWSESLNKIKNKECDILSLVSETKDRLKFLNFTSPYINTPIVIASKITVPYSNDINYLSGKKLGVVKGYSLFTKFKNKYPNISLVEVDSIEAGLEKVKLGKLFGYIDNSYVINNNIQNKYLGILTISGKFEETIELSIGVRNDEEILLSIFEKGINSIDNITKQKILNNWVNINFKKIYDYDFLFKILGVVLFILIFFLYADHRRRKMNLELKVKVEKELKKSREKDNLLFHQNKIVSMGQMIENIAHQWRQPLSQINSSVLVIDAVLEEKNITDKTILDKLNEIESITKYMSETIDDFRDFTSQNKERIDFNVYDIVNKSINIVSGSLLHNKIKLNIKINTKDAVFYNGYPNELQQVVLVILNNAKDALISRKIKNPEISMDIIANKKEIKILIKDNAMGIQNNIIDKIFEPYFTTKHKSKGTGLGLYLSKKIIEEGMNGTINVENEEDGAKFTIILRKENL